MVGGLDAVGAVLANAGVAQADFMLVVQPCLVELGAGGVENPAAKPTPHGGQVLLVGLAVGSGECGEQVGVGADEAVPDVEDGIDLGRQYVTGATKRAQIILAQ